MSGSWAQIGHTPPGRWQRNGFPYPNWLLLDGAHPAVQGERTTQARRMVPTELSSLGRREVVVVIGKIPEHLGIWPVSADASATTGVKEAQAAKEDSKGQAQAARL